jgi:hypothetical protein
MTSFFVKFDESLSSNLMSRSRQNVARKIENEHTSFDRSRTDIRHSIIENEHASFAKSETRRSEKLTMRWSSMITRMNRSNNLCKKQIWVAFLRSHLTLRYKTQNTLLTYFRSNSKWQCRTFEKWLSTCRSMIIFLFCTFIYEAVLQRKHRSFDDDVCLVLFYLEDVALFNTYEFSCKTEAAREKSLLSDYVRVNTQEIKWSRDHVSCFFARYDLRFEEFTKSRSFQQFYTHLLICWFWMNMTLEASSLYRMSWVKLIRRSRKRISSNHTLNWYVRLDIFDTLSHTLFVLELFMFSEFLSRVVLVEIFSLRCLTLSWIRSFLE